ncbi:MAG: cob(I)yrinic acid a,c-diamide adenosyltransferase [Chloroflexi bacterium]|jgi:cob(I)alamin adenosyltransferase|nr:cob(I)yrinic acid a,c-diamide adenosyltransferase [Chloroflexota bacterium]
MKKGLLIVCTGDGKGKTTAALGMMFRALGHGMRVAMLQFMKSPDAGYGEYQAAKRFGVEILQLGDGCTWNSADLNQSAALAVQAWEQAKERIVNGGDDLLVLDEFTFPFHFGWLDAAEAADWLKTYKPQNLHLVVTGRGAPSEFLELADLATDAMEIKHPYQRGVQAQAGIEF